MSDKQKIGFIGLGKMGLPMSRNLVKAGYPVTVWNRTVAKTKEVEGAAAAGSIQELAQGSQVVISMISDDPALASLSTQVLEGAGQGLIYIDMSTVSPVASSQVAEACRAKGVEYLRAPVSGSTALAEAGTLTVLCSGPKAVYDGCEPIFLSMGQKSFHVGPGDEARYLKLTLNMMVGLTSAMAAEALTFSEKGGMDWETMLEIVANSVVASPLIGYKINLLKERNFAPAFTAGQMAKDFDIALGTGQAMDLPMPLTSLVRQFYGAMKAQGQGDLDFFGLLTQWEAMGGIKK
jgi:3-hydroxyisobutyrate dehydrogenase-like beta-hydroxyacid dehydrogenase